VQLTYLEEQINRVQAELGALLETHPASKKGCLPICFGFIVHASIVLPSFCSEIPIDFCNVSYVFGIHQYYNHDLFPLCTARMSTGSPLTGVTLFANQRDP
jgi:hypothetical protein